VQQLLYSNRSIRPSNGSPRQGLPPQVLRENSSGIQGRKKVAAIY
jgi:hypothetical protein